MKYAVRYNDFKLVINKEMIPELYDLKNDISEQNNIAKKYPAEVKKINILREKWESQLINPNFDGLNMSKGKKD